MPKGLLVVAALALAGVLLAVCSEPADAATTFTVNRVGDASDRNINNSVCDVSRRRGKQCTLRAAIEEANNTPGADVINFRIGSTSSVKTISPARPLPTITEAVTINGYTQRGASENTLAEGNDAVLKVQLNGTNAPAETDGLTITASNSTVRGLAINRFDNLGILIRDSGATGNTVEGNFIGTNAAGSGDLGNGAGVAVALSARDNTIGGTSHAARNIISGNEVVGVGIVDGAENKVEGNFIGTAKDGTSPLGNGVIGGVLVSDAPDNTIDAPDNTIGGTSPAARNVISGNDDNGVVIRDPGATGNKVEGNFIGTDASGTQDLGNGDLGVEVLNAPNNTIGGTAARARNVISGNDDRGVLIRNPGATGNTVEGNFIGTNFLGSGDLGNGTNGVEVFDAANNTIGGTAAGARNKISGNGAHGVSVLVRPGNSVLSNEIRSNTGLGINLSGDPENAFGVNANDTDDPDTGANNLQNFPVIEGAASSDSLNRTAITGTINSNPNQSFTIQCFVADDDPSNHGEGAALVAQTTVTTNANGDGDFVCEPPTKLRGGEVVSATATNTATGDTSEFSRNRTVVSVV